MCCCVWGVVCTRDTTTYTRTIRIDSLECCVKAEATQTHTHTQEARPPYTHKDEEEKERVALTAGVVFVMLHCSLFPVPLVAIVTKICIKLF